MGADDFHDVGVTGSGVKVGIIDGFSLSTWNAAVTAGDLPGAPAGTFCRVYGSGCYIWDWGGDHGVGVAEIVHEMAPDASLYLATAFTTADFQAAIDYFASQGVQVVTRSQTAEFDGPGNGTGPLAEVIDSAASPIEIPATSSPVIPLCALGEPVQIRVRLVFPGNGTANDTLEFMTNGAPLEYWQNPYSVTGPMADSTNPGMLTVGAADLPVSTTIAFYSAEGPTNNGSLKPDIVAASCLGTTAYSPNCFRGTSASAPSSPAPSPSPGPGGSPPTRPR